MFINVLCCKVLVGVTLLSQSSNALSQFSGIAFMEPENNAPNHEEPEEEVSTKRS